MSEELKRQLAEAIEWNIRHSNTIGRLEAANAMLQQQLSEDLEQTQRDQARILELERSLLEKHEWLANANTKIKELEQQLEQYRAMPLSTIVSQLKAQNAKLADLLTQVHDFFACYASSNESAQDRMSAEKNDMLRCMTEALKEVKGA